MFVAYRAEPGHCHRFPGPASGDLRGGPKRNFQVFSALDFLAEVTQHIPDKGEHLVRSHGWYSHRQRASRAKLAANDNSHLDRSAVGAQRAESNGSKSTWAMLIKRVYEVDPLECPHCGGQMKIISFIERCHADVIERILGHVGLWKGPLRTLATARAPPATHTASAELGELTLVLDGDSLDESLQAEPSPPGELQLVLDPEFL